MRAVFASFAMVVVLLLQGIALPANAIAQEAGLSREQKLAQIDAEIARSTVQKSSGIKKVLGGLGVWVVGGVLWYSAIPSDPFESPNSSLMTAALVCDVAGLVLEIWGSYQWWDAAQTSSMLRAKRFDVVLQPRAAPDGSTTNMVALRYRF